MTDDERYETVDLPFYRREIAPFLPPRILDAHPHTGEAGNWAERPWHSGQAGGTYMVTDEHYPPETLLGDGDRCFPDREYHAVCFGYPTPAVNWEKDTAYVAAAARRYPRLHPLVLAGPDLKLSREQYERALAAGGFDDPRHPLGRRVDRPAARGERHDFLGERLAVAGPGATRLIRPTRLGGSLALPTAGTRAVVGGRGSRRAESDAHEEDYR